MEIFVVTMYRYGEREKHSYVLGAWSNLEIAKSNANVEIMWRGAKYFPEILKIKVDQPNGLEDADLPVVVVPLGEMK